MFRARSSRLPLCAPAIALLLGMFPGLAFAQTQPTLTGTLVNMTKDPLKFSGTITVADSKGKQTTFVVTEATTFQFARGTATWNTNFLAQHQGETVAVFAVPDSKPLTAGGVQIILPPPPPPSPPRPPSPVNGTVVQVDKSFITIELPYPKPAVPVQGILTGVTVDPLTGIGLMVVKVGKKKSMVFTANRWTRFYTDQKVVDVVTKKTTDVSEVVTFLSTKVKENVVIHPSNWNSLHAWRVDILPPKVKGDLTPTPVIVHLATFAVLPTTAIVRVRGADMQPANIAMVLAGEKVSIQPTNYQTPLASKVTIQLPPAIRGVISERAGYVLVVQSGNKDNPVYQKITLTPKTQIRIADNKKNSSIHALHKGAQVTVLPAGPPPHVAEVVQVKPRHTVVRGRLVSFTGQGLVVNVTGGKNPGPVSVVLYPGTLYELVKGKERVLGTAAILYTGADVTVHAVGISPLVAERVEVPPPKKKKK
ncbi:MAG TPA: hypothetical protein VKE98_16540 [Gemmataceae bacterium]|nr:hypothetical protein [Gemmataceae bacterium]